MPAKDDDNEEDTTPAKEADSESDDEVSKPPREFDLGFMAKLSFFTFIIFLMLSSDVFVERVMGHMSQCLVDGRNPSKLGILTQGLVLMASVIVMAYAITKEKI
jgi:hypothetical protein